MIELEQQEPSTEHDQEIMSNAPIVQNDESIFNVLLLYNAESDEAFAHHQESPMISKNKEQRELPNANVNE